MEAKAIHRGTRISAQKTRLAVDQIRGLSTERVLNVLMFSPKEAAGVMKKVVESVIANAEHNEGVDISELKAKSTYIDKATSLKCPTARAKGRGNHIEKQICHITVTLGN